MLVRVSCLGAAVTRDSTQRGAGRLCVSTWLSPHDRSTPTGSGLRSLTRLRTSGGYGVTWFLLHENEQVALTLLKLVQESGASGKRIHDANLAAVAQTHGVPAIVTLDAVGFAAYGAVRALDLEQLWAETIS